ncbi:MAG: undecaprenyl/decaprenyl-phosphate alpha-N-acetylglucosaminyl 1-phosphate transferase [Chloroflexi bacterium]|nr:undecaprenyl/decaprenyl-phosphate alpha-N-acetylglucosaminyl 1-phosphate transferase [Chloroflexota bacterium]
MHYFPAYLTVFGVALGASLFGTPVVRRFANRWGVLDQPSQRKVHVRPTPLLGGVAIYAGFWLAVLIVSRLEVAAPEVFLPATTIELGAIFVATLTLMLLGLADDMWKRQQVAQSETDDTGQRKPGGLPPHVKLAGQLLAALIAVAGGLQFEVFGVWWLDVSLTVLWIVGISNAINLLDNMDGLSAGATTIAASFFFIIAALNGQLLVGIMALALAGACLGFLRYNFNPATVFMGDAGTLFMGFLLAAIGLKLKATGPAWWSFVLVVVVLALPIFDTSLVTAYRLWKGRHVAQGGKDHTSHRLVKLGLPHRQAVLVLYAASVAAGTLALALARGGQAFGEIVALPALALTVGAGLLLARIET